MLTNTIYIFGGYSLHYSDVIMGTMGSQITSLTIVYSTVYCGANQRKQKSSASLAFVMGIHRWPVNTPYKGQVTRKMFPFDDVIIMRSPKTIHIANTLESTLIRHRSDIFASNRYSIYVDSGGLCYQGSQVMVHVRVYDNVFIQTCKTWWIVFYRHGWCWFIPGRILEEPWSGR